MRKNLSKICRQHLTLPEVMDDTVRPEMKFQTMNSRIERLSNRGTLNFQFWTLSYRRKHRYDEIN